MRSIILFIVLIAIFFYRELFLNRVIYCCDNFLINVPAKVYLIEELKQGRFPLWNPYIFSGTPFFADINNALLYPLNILYASVSPFGALTWGIILNFMIALVGIYLFARSLKVSPFGSFVAAIVFGFSGTMVVYTNNAPMIQVASLLPWVLWGVSKNLIVGVLFASLQIVSGHPQLTYLTWLFVCVYLLWLLTRSHPVRIQGETFIKQFIILISLIFLLTAVQTIPFLEFVRLSTRFNGDYRYATFDSLHPLSVARLIIPNIVGNLSEGFVLAQGGSVYGYVGVLALLLALFAPRKKSAVRFFVFTAIISFMLALGKHTPVYWVAYHVLPGLSYFRSPQHFLLLYTFSIAILAGFSAQQLVQKKFIQKLIIIIIFAELFLFSRNNLLTVPEAQVADWLADAKVTAQKLDDQGRILVDQKTFPNPYAKGKPFIDVAAETSWQAKILRPNLNMLYHIPSYDGYASLVLQKYRDFINPNSKDPTGVDFRNISIEQLKSFGSPDITKEREAIDRATRVGLRFSIVGLLALGVVALTSVRERKISR